MLTAAFICLIFAIIAVFLGYKRTQTTYTLIAKIFFYFLAITFYTLVVSHIVTTAPPISPAHASKRPL